MKSSRSLVDQRPQNPQTSHATQIFLRRRQQIRRDRGPNSPPRHRRLLPAPNHRRSRRFRPRRIRLRRNFPRLPRGSGPDHPSSPHRIVSRRRSQCRLQPGRPRRPRPPRRSSRQRPRRPPAPRSFPPQAHQHLWHPTGRRLGHRHKNALPGRLDPHHRAASPPRRSRAANKSFRKHRKRHGAESQKNRKARERRASLRLRFRRSLPAMIKELDAKLLTLDSRYRLLEFRDAGITAATPNEPEVEAAYHSRVGTDTRKLEDLGQRALRDLNLQALVVTRGKDGMALFERTRVPRNIPIYGSDAPVDVTGAGDTVIAVFTLALASGATYLEAAHLANYAGGIVVMKRRTATVTSAELTAALRQDATASAAP